MNRISCCIALCALTIIGVSCALAVSARAAASAGDGGGRAEIACGVHHSLAIRSDGTLWAWGADGFGGSAWTSPTPTRMPVPRALARPPTGRRSPPAPPVVSPCAATVRCGPGAPTAWDSSARATRTHVPRPRVSVRPRTGRRWPAAPTTTVSPCAATARCGAGATTTTGSLASARPMPTRTTHRRAWAHRLPGSRSRVVTVRLWRCKATAVFGPGAPTASAELGLGDTSDRHAPVRIGRASNWTAVSGGGGFTLALRSSGTLWAWGQNAFGELGLAHADRSAHPTPARVGTAGDWTAIAAGLSASLATRSDS